MSLTPRKFLGWVLPLVSLLVLGLASPAMAQDDGGGASGMLTFIYTKSMFGNFIIWLCLVLSMIVIGLIIQIFLGNRDANFTPPDLVENLDRLLNEKNYREAIELTNADNSPFGQIMRSAMAEAPRGYVNMENAIETAADEISGKRVRKLIWLDVLGAVGPMLGLFGTVFGMILAFQELVSAGGAPKPAELAAGIATSLVTTFWGLVVGIPGVIGASVLRVKIEGLTAEGITQAKSLIAPFKPGAAKRPAAAAPATPRPA